MSCALEEVAPGPERRRVLRTLVVEKQRTFAELLARALDHEDDLETVGIAATAAEALGLLARVGPDVAILDVELVDITGIELCVMMRHAVPDLHVVILTADASPEVAVRAAHAGAAAFLPKSGSLSSLLTAVRNTESRYFTVDPELLLAMVTVPVTNRDAGALTMREQEILDLMGRGLDAQAIARRMHLSLHTTRGYTKSLYRKLGVHSRLEAVTTAARTGELRL